MTTQTDFQGFAAELLGEEFGSLRKNAVLRKSGAFDYATQAASVSVQTVKMTRRDFSHSQLDGQNILIGDYELIGEYQHLVWDPQPDNTEVDFDSQRLTVKNWGKDAADACFWLQVRLK
jgi:hypothetical protein